MNASGATNAAAGARVDLTSVAARAIALYAFSIPFDEILFIPGIGSPARLAGLVAMTLGIIALLRGGRLRFHRPLLLLAVATVYALWNVASYYWSYLPSATIGESGRLVQLVAFVFLVQEFCRPRARWIGLLQAFVLGNYVSFAITTYTVLVASSGFRQVGPFNANQFAVILALGIPVAALLMGERRSRVLHLLNLAYPLIATFGVVLAASRTGLIVSTIALLVVPLSFVRLSPLRRVALATAAAAALVFSYGLAPQVFPSLFANLERLAETGDELATGTLTQRTTIWRATLTVFEDSPIVGIGSGATRFALAETDIGQVRAVHNAYLSVAASTGLIGLGLFAMVICLSVAAAFMATPRDRPYFVVLALALLVSMMPANSESRKDTWFVLALLAVQRPIVLSRTVESGWMDVADWDRTSRGA